ncbi:MAG: hypothetical protein ACXVA9_08060 [Bdellovibrionales bacterium]
MRFATLTVLLISLAIADCVSVKLAAPEAKRATGVSYVSPPKPFVKDASKEVDAAWQNPKNGNLISYLTDCQDDNDTSLESIIQGALGGLVEMKFDKKENTTIQNREARRVVVSGKVDGVPSQIDLLTFKRDSCIYILSYVGVQKTFHEDHAAFDKFVEGFRAP